MSNDKILVTQSSMPSLDEYIEEIKPIFECKWLTNMGPKHNELQKKLEEYLNVKHMNLFTNGHLALYTAIQSLKLKGEVITTPFTFVSTTHAITQNGLTPVFCDIEPDTYTMDVSKIESLITEKTSAIIPVHVYGNVCNVEEIENLAKKYNLKVIYDAAHAFSTEINEKGIGTFGDITMFSFHATKLYNSIEGGCLTYNDENLVRKIYNLRNFGIQSEELVEEVGINGKMNEIQASIGILNLDLYKAEQEKRARVKAFYDENLSKIKGIRIPKMPLGTTNSYQYYPIIVEDDYPINRDELYEKFKKENIFTRKYFYPACHDYECYKNDLTVRLAKLAVVDDLKNRVLCLPFYGDLDESILSEICKNIGCHV